MAGKAYLEVEAYLEVGQGQAGEEMNGDIAQVAAEGLATQALEPEFRFPTPT